VGWLCCTEPTCHSHIECQLEFCANSVCAAVQEFSSDMNSRPVKRIEDVVRLRTAQFSEDSGPIAHPIRPESYIKMDNFYTVTVYEKGAEIIRVYHTLLGKEGFRYCDLEKKEKPKTYTFWRQCDETPNNILGCSWGTVVQALCCVVCFGVMNALQHALNCSRGHCQSLHSHPMQRTITSACVTTSATTDVSEPCCKRQK